MHIIKICTPKNSADVSIVKVSADIRSQTFPYQYIGDINAIFCTNPGNKFSGTNTPEINAKPIDIMFVRTLFIASLLLMTAIRKAIPPAGSMYRALANKNFLPNPTNKTFFTPNEYAESTVKISHIISINAIAPKNTLRFTLAGLVADMFILCTISLSPKRL